MFLSKEIILIGLCVHYISFLLTFCFMVNLKDVPYLFYSLKVINTQKHIKTKIHSNDSFIFQIELHFFFLIFGPIIHLFVHTQTINLMCGNKQTFFTAFQISQFIPSMKTLIFSFHGAYSSSLKDGAYLVHSWKSCLPHS